MNFLVNKTYSEITPESCEAGDFSDTGFDFEDEIYSLSELITLIKREGFYRESRGDRWLTTGFHTTCYKTATDTEYNLHITYLKK